MVRYCVAFCQINSTSVLSHWYRGVPFPGTETDDELNSHGVVTLVVSSKKVKLKEERVSPPLSDSAE